VSSYAYVVVAIYLVLAWRQPKTRPVGAFMLPAAFLLLAAAMLTSKAESGITPTLASWWLTIHVMFAKLCYGSFVAAFSLGVVYLLRDRGIGGGMGTVLAKLPSQETIDDLTFRFVGMGFIFLGMMIAAGAIWANEAWGRYWGWDPIETWSLIGWLVYAAVLHARLTLGWRGKRFAWATVAALPFVMFALIGVPVAYNSIHGAYLKGTGIQ
jgi:cytochrome c-type biogenesis protein CcsB